MADIWFISDIHAFHKNILSFKNNDGSLLRPDFSPVDPNDPAEVSRCLKNYHDTILTNVNKMIKDGDKLYNLGDTTMYHKDAFKEWYLKINTRQHRILFGNHDDPIKLIEMKIFKKTGIWRNFTNENFVASHVPIHRGSMKPEFNVHGHLHQNLVLKEDQTPDPYYINICVEHTNYHPIHIDQIVELIKQRKKKIQYGN